MGSPQRHSRISWHSMPCVVPSFWYSLPCAVGSLGIDSHALSVLWACAVRPFSCGHQSGHLEVCRLCRPVDRYDVASHKAEVTESRTDTFAPEHHRSVRCAQSQVFSVVLRSRTILRISSRSSLSHAFAYALRMPIGHCDRSLQTVLEGSKSTARVFRHLLPARHGLDLLCAG